MDLRRTSITDEVFNILHERITSMYYKTGELLPSQDKLAKEMGVSRNTIREAVNRLSTVGILTAKQGFGTVIQSNHARSAILQTFEDIKKTSKKDAADIIVTRYTVERSIVRLAALSIKKQGIAKLRDNLTEQNEAIAGNDVNRFTELDLRFHLLIADASGSRILRSLEMVNLELYKAIIPEIVFNKQHMNVSYNSHNKIFQALSAQDPIMADKFVTDHILRLIERFPKNSRLAIVKKALATT
jgi:GntR family transcriptional repressor for pyruvate dehydrogenase complex